MRKMDETKQFLDLAFGKKPEDLYILVWSLRGKRSGWFTDLEMAAKYIRKNNEDVYIGVSLSKENRGEYLRYEAKDTAGIVGLWLDIDVYDPVAHKKENLPKNHKEALQLLTPMPVQPTVVIDSGHGIQAWWLFDKPFIYHNDQEREIAALVEQKWNYIIQEEAKKVGWSVDSVHDLARVMRAPGSINAKDRNNKKVVKILLSSDDRRTFADYNDIVKNVHVEIVKPIGTQTPEIGELVLNPEAEPPLTKLFELMKSKAFKASFEHKRNDMIDQSASSYDMSLTDFAVKAGWSDQEIVDLLIYHRRERGEDLKLRQDYYARTIFKARIAAQKAEALNNVEYELSLIKSEEEKRKKGLKIISEAIGVQIDRVIRYNSEPPSYRLVTNRGAVMVPKIDDLIQQTRFRGLIASTCKAYIPKMKAEKWDVVANCLVEAQEDYELGDDVKEAGMVENWIVSYLDFKPPAEELSDSIFAERRPFKKEGECYIFLDDLIKWIKIGSSELITPQRLTPLLGVCGCKPIVMNLEIRGKRTTRRLWSIPHSLLGE